MQMFKLPRTVWLFTVIQSLAMSAGAMMVLVGGVLGATLAPNAKLATLPVAVMIIGTAMGVVPVTRMMGRFGRKPIFISVALLAMCGALLAAYAAYLSEFYLFLSAALCIGFAVSGFQQTRFAAMESVSPDLAPKAASTVLLGGLVAAILGPELVTLGRDISAQPFVGTFLMMAVLCLLCALLFSQIQETHKPVLLQDESKESIRPVVVKPLFIVAVSASVIGYGLMSFIMTATPVHMHVLEHHSLEHTKWVIQSHIIAMFLPSFFSGWLIAKFGAPKVIILGLFAYLMTLMLALAGQQLLNYWLALIFLGLGWNFLFLGGTVLLPQTHNAQQKMRVQGVHELLVFSMQAITALSAGVLLYSLGWRGILFSSLMIIILHVGLLVWQMARYKADELKLTTEQIP